jgi:prophage regulatory protein
MMDTNIQTNKQPDLAAPHPIKVLRLPEVVSRVGLKRASIYLHIAHGTFPKQITLGDRAVGWIESEIDAWLTAKIKNRGNSETQGV